MKYILLLLIPATVYSQGSIEKDILPIAKTGKKESFIFFKQNSGLSDKFINAYLHLISTNKKHTRKDSIKANTLLKKLNGDNKKIFTELMQTILSWEFCKHLEISSLLYAKQNLKNSSDSAFYYYTFGIYFKDSLNEIVARKFGYVIVNSKDEEIVDWQKMKRLVWNNQTLTESVSGFDFSGGIKYPIADSSFSYLQKAVSVNPHQFFYLRELAYYFYKFGQNNELVKNIFPLLKNYSKQEIKWIRKHF